MLITHSMENNYIFNTLAAGNNILISTWLSTSTTSTGSETKFK